MLWSKTIFVLQLISCHQLGNARKKQTTLEINQTTTKNWVFEAYEYPDYDTWESPEGFLPNTTLYTWSPAIPGTHADKLDYDETIHLPEDQKSHLPLNIVQLDRIHDVRYPTREYQTGTIIFLHPEGEFGVSWKEFIEAVKTELRFWSIKVIYPSAPRRRYSLAHGEVRYIWFDEWDTTPFSPEKPNSFKPSFDGIDQIMQEELRNNISEDRIMIGGMGMGGEFALHLGYRKYTNIRAVFALSSHLRNNSIVYQTLAERKKTKVPYLFASYSRDSKHSKLKWAKDTFRNLQRLGVKGEFHNLNLIDFPRTMDSPLMDELFKWIIQILPDM